MATVTELVAAQRERITNLTTTELSDVLANTRVTLVDVREPDEIAATGRIPDAVCVPRGLLEFKADPTSPVHHAALNPQVRTVLYCASGGRSALAAGALLDLGYENVEHLDGGIRAWMEAGQAIEPA